MTKKTTMLRYLLATLSLLCLPLASCGDPDRGTECSSQDDCADDQSCVPIAFGCAESGDGCDATCEVSCQVDEDCGSNEICANRNGHEICRSTDIDDPSE